MTDIHPTAIVETGAAIGENVRVGPYSTVGPNVRLADNVVLESHVVVAGHTEVGAGTHIFPFASIGHKPQDLKYAGEETRLLIGKNNQIREHVTMNPGTSGGGGLTRVGDNGLFMMGSHVGHDCKVGNFAILANNATLAGHVELADHVILGGLSAVRQWTRIGTGAIVGGMTGVEFDVIPFGSVIGDRARLAGLNLIGLKRKEFPREQIHALRAAYRDLFDTEDGTLRARAEAVAETAADQPLVKMVTDFILEKDDRRFCTPRSGE
ncbi:acyl-[acyl-carrier-protein]--UDP-N-acetylglucosamine O-acyltransferase [Roseibium hamelinense]|uniref:Acyl-[acyl-carrier-protein]--UDP-N-acetylglucosamine O-acyltransferase n=1 Tax=Roseibium hamelinense TaxID=150831 RepID=A0A562TGU2_9HYPH|nr:acyl-ACP--UDP-N-acetylglucosamine O-acyltransferase [Roseibium hamelinense]MTI45962.1 acyl-ACP--UDP-N-acetylglucosamine O-acyltransferase [Roseibium hamelinense]TWI92849.1 acyl-[acyl-carrier-protein]--UDP-N-acetylglucosamine O-acyltransferase [Roseibium hamelinense]